MKEKDTLYLYLSKVTSLFEKITFNDLCRYTSYWQNVKPVTEQQIYLCWLYAMVTVNMSESKSTPIFEQLADLDYGPIDQDAVRSIFVAHRAGLHNTAAVAISDFATAYFKNPHYFQVDRTCDHATARKRLLTRYSDMGLKRIGITKMSFLFELLFPLSSRVVCIDRHVARWFGVNKKSLREYDYSCLEHHWLCLCDKYTIPSPIARHILWDKYQESNRYNRPVTHDIDFSNYWAAGLKQRINDLNAEVLTYDYAV